MSSHINARLHDGFVTASRLVARLHALGVDVDELHVSSDRMCIHLSRHDDAPRVHRALARCADASVDEAVPATDARCQLGASRAVPDRTTYVVWSEPLSAVLGDHHRPRITA